MNMSSTCVCKERVESARGQGGSVGSKAAISLAVLALAQLGVSADNGAFSVAMSEMMRVFGCSVADVQLANTVYALMAGTFMLASGLFGLMVGWRRTFVGGMVLIVIGEIVTALAPVVELLIWGGRLAVGVGASLVIPSVLGMVPLLFEGDKRKQAYGVIAGSAALATIVPIPLGMLVDNFGFRFTFGALVAYFGALVAASLALPASQPRASKKFDLVGAALASMGLFAVMFGLSRISAWGVADPLPTAPFTIFGLSPAPFIVIAGMVLLIVLVPVELWMERAHDVAILPSSFIKSAQVRSGVVAIALPFSTWAHKAWWPRPSTSSWSVSAAPARRFWASFRACRCSCSPWVFPASSPRRIPGSWCDAVTSLSPSARLWRPLAFGAPS